MKFFNIIRFYGFAVFIVILAASLRLYPLQSLGQRTVWVTFYPAVMVVALYGGLWPGLLASFLSCFIVLVFWPIFVPSPFIKDFGDWLSLAIFLITCTGISVTAEAMRISKQKIKLAKEQAEKANKAKSVFLSNMSHELRTPLNAILGFSSIMSKDVNATSEQRKNLDIIIRSGEHLLNLINNVLDIAKIESGKIHLEEKETNLLQMIHEVHSLMGVKAIEKNLEFKLLCSSELPDCVKIDAGKLRQVLINLIGNAIKFTSEGSVTFSAMTNYTEDPAKRLIRFEVQDTGSGIADKDMLRIFQPFEQIETHFGNEKGTGLGLAISKQNIGLMGGTINAESVLGSGSVFYVEIPVEVVNRESLYEANRLGQVIGFEPKQPVLKILIVEDQFENRLLLNQLLLSAGFLVLEALNGKEAIELCRDQLPDLIFMDMRMPVMSGAEATRRIKSDPKLTGTKIVALTAHALEDERLEMMDAGCDEFIRKPYHDTEIFDSIARLLSVTFNYGENSLEDLEMWEMADNISLEYPSEKFKKELLKASILLDQAGCISLIDNTPDMHSETANYLVRLANGLKFQKLINILESSIVS